MRREEVEKTQHASEVSVVWTEEAEEFLRGIFHEVVALDIYLAAKNGVTVLNTPGTIDADYRGEVKVILVNLGEDSFEIERGMRIAQMVIAPVTQASFTEVDSLSETERGSGGFGSTGT